MLDVRRGRGGPGLESAWPSKFGGTVCGPLSKTPIAQSSCVHTHPSALSAVLGVVSQFSQ